LRVLVSLLALIALAVTRPPRVTRPDPAASTISLARAGSETSAARLMSGGRLDARRASLRDFQLIDGVGPRRARELVAARSHDALHGLDDADRLQGFGPALLSRLDRAVAFPEGKGEE